MPRFSRSFLFPDVNVWMALTYGGHVHHKVARTWFEEVNMEARVCFCRFTQISLLRLLTTQAVMGTDEVMTQTQAWQAFDSRIVFVDEPPNLEELFRSLSRQHSPNPKTWANSYLAAFAAVSDMYLVTFDQAFQGKVRRLLILRP